MEKSLALLEEIQAEIDTAINSHEFTVEGLVHEFTRISLAHISELVKSYVCLRKLNMRVGAEALLRSFLEVAVKTIAVNKNPLILLKVFLDETRQAEIQIKMAKTELNRNDVDEKAIFDARRKDFRARFKLEFPLLNNEIVGDKHKLNIESVMKDADLGFLYNSHYRSFCGFVHGSLDVMVKNNPKLEFKPDIFITNLLLVKIIKPMMAVDFSFPSYQEFEDRHKEIIRYEAGGALVKQV